NLLASVARLPHRHQPRVAGLALGIDIGAGLDATVGQRKTVRDRAHLNGCRTAVDRSVPGRRAWLPVRHDARRAGLTVMKPDLDHTILALHGQAYFLLAEPHRPLAFPC